MVIGDLTLTSLELITAFEISGEYMFTLDELQNTSIAQTQDEQEITGKGGRRLSTLKRNKGVTISGANGLVSGGLLAAQTGSELELGDGTSTISKYVEWRDYLSTETAGTYTLKYSPKDGALDGLFIKNQDGTIGAELELTTSTPEEGEYKISGTTITVDSSSIAASTELIALYKRSVMASEFLEDVSDKFSKTCQLYVDALAEDKCGNTYYVQFYLPKVSLSGEFTIDMGENQTVHNFEGTAESGACGGAGSSSSFFTYTVFSDEDQD